MHAENSGGRRNQERQQGKRQLPGMKSSGISRIVFTEGFVDTNIFPSSNRGSFGEAHKLFTANGLRKAIKVRNEIRFGYKQSLYRVLSKSNRQLSLVLITVASCPQCLILPFIILAHENK
ncbi:hypothetical protein CSKR_202793 [Clonorchis sinensis]|uniref:Uncharacterized protein n=1 Tax=Clonorchis sinensis TaxID=79923 RepID=A0A8T1M248_CLOSI|nr:hypothetical protein CSKR_202793 [Clonorchis sinensis]